MNYSLVFYRDRGLDGVVIIGGAPSGVATGEDRTVGDRRSISSTPPKKHMNNAGAFEVVRNSQPPSGPVMITDKDLESLKVIRNVPPPGSFVEVTEGELESFGVIRNCAPPGGPIEVTAEELHAFKIIKNCPPPGS
jgi:hypothetical protein